MDLEECSRSRSEDGEEGQETKNLEKTTLFDGIEDEINGELGHEESSEIGVPTNGTPTDGDVVGEGRENGTPTDAIGSSVGEVNANGDGIGAESVVESALRLIGSPSDVVSEAAAVKGFGLKKWRRIRRDMTKDGSGGADSAQILKRRLSIAEPSKARDEHKQKSDGEGSGSVASLESRNTGRPPNVVATGALDPEIGLLVAEGGFSVGTDSENSEDRSSKSSTAASAPKLKHEIGFGRERNRGKNISGKGSGHVMQQRGQRGRGGGVDASKKLRGDQIRFEKENSHSSVESDLRSSNAVFVRWGSILSNGRQSDKSLNYDGDNSDEAQACEEVRAGYHEDNGGEVDDLLGEDLDADLLEEENFEKSENRQAHVDLDPYAESIILLQAAQEALENEIQKFGEIGKEPISAFEGSSDQFDETEGSSSLPVEANLIELNQKIEHLEQKLEEASATVQARESKVLELEAFLNKTQSLVKETGSGDLRLLQEKHKEMEFELEDLFKRRIEVEIEYLTISSTTQGWKVLAKDQIALFEEQKSLAGDQAQMKLKLRDAENKAIMLKEQAEELEASFKELLGTKEVIELQNKVCKLSLCCLVQLVMLCIALGLFLMHLLPLSNGVVPT